MVLEISLIRAVKCGGEGVGRTLKSSLGRYSINHPKFTPDLHNLVLNYCQIIHTCFCSFFFFFFSYAAQNFLPPKDNFWKGGKHAYISAFSHNELNLTPL